MLTRIFLALVLCATGLSSAAAVLPPEKLLPRETDFVITMPDAAAALVIATNSPYGRMWNDPQLKAFKDKFVDKFSSDVLRPLEHTLGVQLSSYRGLAQGQMTFAMLPLPKPDHEQHFSKLFLLDVKDQAAQLRSNLTEARQKLIAAGKPLQTRKIRDFEFTILTLAPEDLNWSKLLPKPKGTPPEAETEKSTNKVELTFGQADSLLLVSDSPATIEKVLNRQMGGLVPALEEQSAFQTDFAGRLHNAPFYIWLNVKDVIDTLMKGSSPDAEDSSATAAVRPDSMLSAAGLTGLTSACFTYRNSPEGLIGQLFIGVPEAHRKGLLKALVNEPKDANPPPFVPADATKFWRWRIDIPHAWATLEKTINELNPQYASVINFILGSAGKDKDEKYDLKAELLNNLGDDVIHYEKAPRGTTLASINNAPSIYLIGSPNPEKLAAALKTGMSIMGPAKDREFLGRQIYTITTGGQNNAPVHSFSFAGSGAYLAISDENDVLEEYLRSNDKTGKALADTPGLTDATQKVGGTGTGFFGFDNQTATMKAAIEVLRTQPVTLQDILGTSPMTAGTPGVSQVAQLKDWMDFALFPPFDSISKYFYFSVYAGSFSADGFTVNFFSPTPPKLR